MIDLDYLEGLAKAAKGGLPGDRITFMVHFNADAALSLIAEVRASRNRSIDYLKRLATWCEAPCPGAEIQKHDCSNADFWDVALRADEEEQPACELGRVEYRFLGVTGEEEE